MKPPAIAYRIPVEGAGLQGVGSADRPVCAMLSAYAQHKLGAEMRGEWRGQTPAENQPLFDAYFRRAGVPPERVERFAAAINLAKAVFPPILTTSAGGLTADPYQMQTVVAVSPAGWLIGAMPGMGKTLMAVLAVLNLPPSQASTARCWIVCPLNAVGVWERWKPVLQEKFAEVIIISRDSLHKVQGLDPLKGGVIIFDEIHGFRHREAARTKLAHQLRLAFDFGLGLTGTLLHGGNAVEGALSMLDLCIPGAALFASRWKAGEHFACLVRKDLGGRKVTALERPTGDKRTQFLAFLARYSTLISTTSATVTCTFQLPDQHMEEVRFGEPWRPLHEQAAEVALEVLAATGEMPHAAAIAHRLCRAGIDAKLEWLDEAWDDRSEPVAMFAQYQDTLDATEEWMKAEGITYVRVDGAVCGSDRAEAVRKFQAGEVQAFLGQVGAAGIAVDLYRARFSVAIDHTWKGDEHAQMLRRTARRGQTRECFHFDLVANQLQTAVVRRLRLCEDFNTEAIEFQDIRRTLVQTGSSSLTDNPF